MLDAVRTPNSYFSSNSRCQARFQIPSLEHACSSAEISQSSSTRLRKALGQPPWKTDKLIASLSLAVSLSIATEYKSTDERVLMASQLDKSFNQSLRHYLPKRDKCYSLTMLFTTNHLSNATNTAFVFVEKRERKQQVTLIRYQIPMPSSFLQLHCWFHS